MSIEIIVVFRRYGRKRRRRLSSRCSPKNQTQGSPRVRLWSNVSGLRAMNQSRACDHGKAEPITDTPCIRVQSSIGQAGFSIGQNCPVPIDERPCPELESASDRIHMCAVRTSRANILRDPRVRSNYSGCRRLPLAHRPSLPFGGNAVPIFNRFHHRAIGREISGGTVRKVQLLGR